MFYFLFPKFTTDDCERTKGCFRSPQSCTTSDNCDFLVTYRATNSTHVEFELSGKGAWIAVGFSDDQNMVGYLVDQERKLIQYQSYPLLNNDTSIQWLNLWTCIILEINTKKKLETILLDIFFQFPLQIPHIGLALVVPVKLVTNRGQRHNIQAERHNLINFF